VTSDNDWHYIYPPLYAILLTPFADPPPTQDHTGYLDYPWSVALCYLGSLVCLFWGAHVLASALEEASPDPSFRSQPAYCRRWWALRMWPVWVCWLPIGHTLSRGQVNIFILAILCAAQAGWLRGQRFRAGLWLAFAICIKVIPAYLLVYPLWKRDGRSLLGCAAGLLAGLVLIPLAAFGPQRMQVHYETYGRIFFAPFFKLNLDPTVADEILGGVNNTESVGVRNALHNWMYPDPDNRPADLTTAATAIYLLLGVGMTFATLRPMTRPDRRGFEESSGQAFSALVVLMTIFSPVCHSHYLAFCLPVVMTTLAAHWQFRPTVGIPRELLLLFVVFFVTTAVAYLPSLEVLKDLCAGLFVTLPFWVIAVRQLWRGQSTAPIVVPSAELQRAA
jgi:hypothetical protein